MTEETKFIQRKEDKKEENKLYGLVRKRTVSKFNNRAF
jgi:hypothetical protein